MTRSSICVIPTRDRVVWSPVGSKVALRLLCVSSVVDGNLGNVVFIGYVDSNCFCVVVIESEEVLAFFVSACFQSVFMSVA